MQKKIVPITEIREEKLREGKRREECCEAINPTDQSDFVRSIAVQLITCGDQSEGLIGTIDREAIDSEN